MFETGDWSEGDVVAVLANPIYAVPVDPQLCDSGPQIWSEDQWVASNVELIEHFGSAMWLRFLANILRDPELCHATKRPAGARPDDSGLELGVRINPATAIRIHRRFAAPHIRDQSESEWIETNARLIDEDFGPEIYLQNLLAILRGATLREDGNFFGYRDASSSLDSGRR